MRKQIDSEERRLVAERARDPELHKVLAAAREREPILIDDELPILATYVIRFRAPRVDMSNAEMDAALAAVETLLRNLPWNEHVAMADFTVEIEPKI